MKNKTISVICFGGLDWWYHPRAHADFQMIKRFPKYGPTLYINSIVMQKPNFKNKTDFIKRLRRKLKSIFTGLKKVDNNFWVYSPFSIPLHHIVWIKQLNVMILTLQIKIVSKLIGIKNPLIWVVIPVAYPIAKRLKGKKIIYYKLDKYELFPNVDYQTVKKLDIETQKHVDLSIFVSMKLYNEKDIYCRNPRYIDHGVDYEFFSSARDSKYIPDDISKIKGPIIGYFGTIDKHTVDIEFLAQVAGILSGHSFVFVGPCVDNYYVLTKKINVWMLGSKPYEEVPHYGKKFDVAIMAWQNTEWIKMCNPIKLKEYLALGKPVVTTPYPELHKYKEQVYIASTPEDFSKLIVQALKENNQNLEKKRMMKVEDETWDRKVLQVLDALNI